MVENFKSIHTALVTLALLIFVSACGSEQKQTDEEHAKEVNEWHQKRISNLTGPEDWLKLAGLYKLEDGTLSFGSDSTNDLVFPKGAPSIGTITKEDTTITVDVNSDISVTHNEDTVSQITMTPGSARSGTVLQHNSLVWYLLDHRGDYYIRLVDEEHPNLEVFDGIERFPIDQKWKIKAKFKPFDEPRPITVPDVLNEGIPDTVYGKLEFSIDGKEFSIDPLNHPQKDEKFYIIFGDKTNGQSTYGGGRYIYIPTPGDDGTTYIDFNRAYNPPCVFTEFATCPLPPAQNRLNIAIPAGEKMFDDAKSY